MAKVTVRIPTPLRPLVGKRAELILEGKAKTVDITPLKMNRFESGETNTTSYEFKVIA